MHRDLSPDDSGPLTHAHQPKTLVPFRVGIEPAALIGNAKLEDAGSAFELDERLSSTAVFHDVVESFLGDSIQLQGSFHIHARWSAPVPEIDQDVVSDRHVPAEAADGGHQTQR